MKTLIVAWLVCASSLVRLGAQTVEPPLSLGVVPTYECPELGRAIQDLIRSDSRARDFAQLGRYREANRALSPADESRTVFLGDSITDSWSQPQFGDFFRDRRYVNRGISGQTTAQMLLRFRQDVIELKPRVVVIHAGTNDIAGNTGPVTQQEISANLASMAELATAHKIRVVFASVLPVSAYHFSPMGVTPPMTTRRPPARIVALNEWIKSYAGGHGHLYIDYYSAMVDTQGMLKTEFSHDDLHPNARGYAVMAPLAESAIGQALTLPGRPSQ